ncbi:MAG TPA: efflux RND transporter periplasmic adaptor subunit [Planctomycetaceae bacterium]|jgi:multidrug efflux pump subunit AcrA (membrane-fusion protein)
MICVAAVLAGGCGHKAKPKTDNEAEAANVRVVHPAVRKIVRTVGQPSFIEAYERTSIYPKVTGYIEKWNVDIGDRVKKDDVLATLFVPELVEDFGTKKATVDLDKERIDLALKIVDVSAADVQAAEARLTESKSILAQYEAQVERWDSEVARLTREVKKGVVDPQVQLESTNQLKSSRASRDAAEATIKKAEAELLSKQAALAKAKVDVDVARADLRVAESEARRLGAWVGYLKLASPYDGIIVARNANTFDFVTPSVGDPTAMQQAPYLAPGAKAAPIYVVDRIDVVRIFVDIPEQDANYVQVGTKATVLARAYRDETISASVTRTSWALNVKSRTLRAEIDLPNTDSRMLPGMYAYGNVIIEHPNVRALPLAALIYSGEQIFIWQYKDGHAVRTEVEIGTSDDEWVEVTNRRIPDSHKGHAHETRWTPIDGSEQVLVGDLSNITEGGPVRINSKGDSTKASGADSDRADTTSADAGRSDESSKK